MATFLIQSTASTVVFYLETLAGAPATGLTYTAVSASLKKSSDAAFISKTLTAINFVELDGGYYSLGLSVGDTAVLGTLYVRIQGSTIRSELVDAYVAVSAPDAPVTGPTLDTAALYGHVYKADGTARSGVSVQVRVLSQPTLVYEGSDGLVLVDELITARTDSEGYFIITLVAGCTVDFMIPAANYRRVLTVPSSNQNVFDIP